MSTAAPCSIDSANALISGMDELLQRSLGPQIELTLDLAATDPVVHSEPTQLELAILNLAINARDAMDDRGAITISTARVGDDELPSSLQPGEYVRISVLDNGCGMPPEIMRRAIDPFFTTKEVGKGTGLGLSMAYGFARQSGGLLDLHSEEGAGTRVDIYLPAGEGAAGTSGAAAGTRARAPDIRRGARSGTITLVDDDNAVRPIIRDMLIGAGYRVEDFASPAEALAEADWVASDLVLLDYIMPGMNGGELAERIRREHADQRIIFITGYADTTPLDALRGPYSRVLRKPFTEGELLAAIDSLMQAESGGEQ